MIQDIPAWRLNIHIDKLVDKGWSLSAIARAADLDQRTVSRIWNGQAIWASKHTADAIQSVRPGITDVDCLRIGAVRRIESLMLQGWCEAEIERQCDVRIGYCRSLRQGMEIRPTKVPQLERFRVALVALMGLRPPLGTAHQRRDATAARNKAIRLGFHDLIVWDDIDDPTDTPHLPGKGRKELPRHGTSSGAKRHRRLGEKPCLACQEAESASKRERNAA